MDNIQHLEQDAETDLEQDAEVTLDDPAQEESDEAADQDQAETFTRPYVEKLRKENAKYRDRAKQADALAERLHTALVAATGRLADPSDLAYDEAHLDDEDALTAAIDDLLGSKPHLASRKPVGQIGQGEGSSGATVDLAGLLRSRAS